jgi:hypothetical protein
MSSATIFDQLKSEADAIIAKYPLLSQQAVVFDTPNKIVKLYYVIERKYYPKYRTLNFPHNIPPWTLAQVLRLINRQIEEYCAPFPSMLIVEEYMDADDIETLFRLFRQFINEAKALAEQLKH